MNYIEYIASSAWKEKRKARLEMDGHKCRLCDEDGTRYQLEVHHRPESYKRLGNESARDDLITVCKRCHDLITNIIREDRYGKREPLTIDQVQNSTREVNYGMARSEIQTDSIGPVNSAQRANGRPDKQMVESTQADYIKAQQDRRRL